MCHAAISAKTGLCESTIQDMKRAYNNLKNGETLVMRQCIRKFMPINEEGSRRLVRESREETGIDRSLNFNHLNQY
jgi:hypothetical protein